MSSVQIELCEVTETHKLALQGGGSDLASLLGVAVPDGWPEFPEAFQPTGAGKSDRGEWPGYFVISRSERTLVGNGGFAGPPDSAGEVEIGYEIAPRFRNRGFATAAVRAFLEVAFSREEVQAVVAHTLAEPNASNAVLKKVGMSFVAELPNPEVGSVWRWKKARAE